MPRPLILLPLFRRLWPDPRLPPGAASCTPIHWGCRWPASVPPVPVPSSARIHRWAANISASPPFFGPLAGAFSSTSSRQRCTVRSCTVASAAHPPAPHAHPSTHTHISVPPPPPANLSTCIIFGPSSTPLAASIERRPLPPLALGKLHDKLPSIRPPSPHLALFSRGCCFSAVWLPLTEPPRPIFLYRQLAPLHLRT